MKMEAHNETEERTCYPGQSNVTASNNTDDAMDTEEDNYRLDLLITITYQHILPMLIFMAMLTNLLNVFMLWKVRIKQKLQKRQDMVTTYCYLMWLAITDLLASMSLIPSLIYLERSELPYGWAFYYAHLEIPIMNSLTSACVYIVVGLSVDRFIAVCFPRRYKTVNARRLAFLRIALSLIIPLLIYIPHCFYQKVVCSKTGMGWTYQGGVLTKSQYWYVWEIVVELCHRVIPAIILAVLNVCIIITFRHIMKQTKSRGNVSGDDGGRAKRDRRLIHLLVAVVSSFLLTNLPATVFALTDTAGSTFGSFHHEVFRAVANCLEILGFSLNFVLYFFFVTGMKEVLVEALKNIGTKLCCGTSFSKFRNSIRLGTPSKSTDETVDL